MLKKRLRKIAVSLCVIFSLFVSAAAACACSHHQVKAKDDGAAACHEISHNSDESQISDSETGSQLTKFDTACDCFVKVSQPFVAGKIENVKTQKLSAVLPSVVKIELKSQILKPLAEDFRREYHFYNSNYLRTLTPPRAPPVL